MTARRYTIAQLAHEFGVTPRALRFYEDKCLIQPVARGVHQERLYTDAERAKLSGIVWARNAGLSIEEIKDVAHFPPGRDRRRALETYLRAHKERLEDELARVNEALAGVQAKARGAA